MNNECKTCGTCNSHYLHDDLIWKCTLKNIAMAKNDGCILNWTKKIDQVKEQNDIPKEKYKYSPMQSAFAGYDSDCEISMIAKIRDSFPILEKYIDINSMISYPSAVLYGIFKYLEEKEISQTQINGIIKISIEHDVLLYKKHHNSDVLIMDIKDDILMGVYYENNIHTVSEWDKNTGKVIASFSPNTKDLIPVKKEWYNNQRCFPQLCEEEGMWFVAVGSNDVDVIYDINGDSHRAGLVNKITREEIIEKKMKKWEL